MDLSYQLFFFGTPTFERFVEDLSLIDRLERLLVLSLTVPHVPVVGRVLDMRLDLTHERDNDPGFGVTRYGAALALSAGYERYVAAQLQTGIEFSDIESAGLPLCIDLLGREPVPGENCIAFCNELDPEDPVDPDPEPLPGNNCIYRNQRNLQLSRQPRGTSLFLVTRALVSVDFRDNPFNPSRGFYGSLSAEHVHSLQPAVLPIENDPSTTADDEVIERSSEFVKLTVLLNGYVPLGFLDWVLALSARFGWIFELTPDNQTFPDRYFYLGGFDAMRGWAEESVTAQDTDVAAGPGGQSMLLLRGELRVPLPSSFGLGFFVDAGNLWRQQTNLWQQFALRVSVGAGLRYQTPVGPVVLDLAWAIPRHEDLERARAELDATSGDTLDLTQYFVPFVHFSIGVF
jgi:outer membrane protein assembly factor BamA